MTQPAVTFSMYVLPEVRDAMQRFWQAVRARLDLPNLPQEAGFDTLIGSGAPIYLMQYCSFPYLKHWQGKGIISPLASLHYDLPHCDGPRHRSVLLVHRDAPFQQLADLRGKRLVINEPDSNTGMNLLRREVAELAGGKPFFASVTPTGSSVNNMNALSEGRADLASVDAVAFGYANRYAPALTEKLRVIGETRDCPSLPLFVETGLPADQRVALFQAMETVIGESETLRQAMYVRGISPADDAALEVSRDYEREAVKLGYPELI